MLHNFPPIRVSLSTCGTTLDGRHIDVETQIRRGSVKKRRGLLKNSATSVSVLSKMSKRLKSQNNERERGRTQR